MAVWCGVAFIFMTVGIMYSYAADGDDTWYRFYSLSAWFWVAVAAALTGSWGFIAMMIGIWQRSVVARWALIMVALLYFFVAGVNAAHAFDSAGTWGPLESGFDMVIIALFGGAFMVPLMLVIGLIGWVLTKVAHG